MTWCQSNNYILSKQIFFVRILINIIIIFFSLFFINLNYKVDCFSLKGVNSYLKEIPHNNKILISTLDLPNYIVMLNYDKNREHYFKLFGLSGTLSYGVPKFFFELDKKLCIFPKRSSFSHYHLYLNYLENIHSSFVFTKNPLIKKFNGYILLDGNNLLGFEKNIQYISKNLHFYSNFYKPQFYDLNNHINNHSDFDQFDLKNAIKIDEFITAKKEFLIEYLKNVYDLLNKK